MFLVLFLSLPVLTPNIIFMFFWSLYVIYNYFMCRFWWCCLFSSALCCVCVAGCGLDFVWVWLCVCRVIISFCLFRLFQFHVYLLCCFRQFWLRGVSSLETSKAFPVRRISSAAWLIAIFSWLVSSSICLSLCSFFRWYTLYVLNEQREHFSFFEFHFINTASSFPFISFLCLKPDICRVRKLGSHISACKSIFACPF